MEQIVQVTALCVVGALLAVVVRRGSPECALVLGIAAAVAVLVFLAQGLEELMAFLAELGERSGIPETLFVPLYKTLGIALVVRVGVPDCAGTPESRPWEAWWKRREPCVRC